MTRYLVTWEIDADADTPEEAAEIAYTHMRRPDSTANVFAVCDEHGIITNVDLQEILETRPVRPTNRWQAAVDAAQERGK